jgi:dephospho-CoA kinase
MIRQPDSSEQAKPASSGRPLRIGLTGGIASGKSTVAEIFAGLEVPIVDTDVIAREVVQPGSPALQVISEEFGNAVIAADGTLDRKAMRKLVFTNEGRRLRLESILHPRIRELAEQQVAAVQKPYLIIVVPLLTESPMKKMMDRILVVDCSEDSQIKRLMERDVETEVQARRIMATQASRKERLAIADDVITNDDDLDALHDKVLLLHHSYQTLSSAGDF